MSEQTPNPSLLRISLQYGTYATLASILVGVATTSFRIQNSLIVQLLAIGIPTIFMFLGVRTFKSYHDTPISFSRALFICFGVVLMVAVIGSLFTYVYFIYIDPESFNSILEQQILVMEERGMSDEQIEMLQRFTTPGLTAFYSFLGNLVFLGIIALVVAFLSSRSKPAMSS